MPERTTCPSEARAALIEGNEPMTNDTRIRTPLGWLGIASNGRVVLRIDWLDAGPERWPEDGLARAAAEALAAWFDDPRALPQLPLAPAPTRFQARVRAALQAIPAGRTRSYGDLAAELGSAARAVGGACRANPLAVIVPCHRVVARSGLGGYSGDWEHGAAVRCKRALLAREAAAVAP